MLMVTGGTPGTQIIPTVGAPSNSVGSDRDYALDSAASTLYGPKSGGVWPAGVFIGNGLITTTGAPANGTGADGNYALDQAAGVIYGPKVAGVWPSGTNLASQTRWVSPTAPAVPTTTASPGGAGRVYAAHFELTRCQVIGVAVFNGGTVAGNVRAGVYGPISTPETLQGLSLVCQSADTTVAGVNATQVITLPTTTVARGQYYVCTTYSSTSTVWYRGALIAMPTGLERFFDQTYGGLPSFAPAAGDITVNIRPYIMLLTQPVP